MHTLTSFVLISACVALVTGGIVDKIPKKFYPHLRNLCNYVDQFKNCMVGKGAITEPEAESLKKEFVGMKVCPLPEDDDEFKKKLEGFAQNEELVARLKSMTKHLKKALECFKEVLGLKKM